MLSDYSSIRVYGKSYQFIPNDGRIDVVDTDTAEVIKSLEVYPNNICSDCWSDGVILEFLLNNRP